MPQIGWLEILAIVIIAILVLGPKEFPIALKKIGSYFGKLKNTLSSFQREVNSVTENIEVEKLKEIDTEVREIIRDSVKKALQSPESPKTNLEEDSYA